MKTLLERIADMASCVGGNAEEVLLDAAKEIEALRTDKATLQQMTYSLKDRLEAAEKDRDDVMQQLVRSEVDKQNISEAHKAVTSRLSSLADENVTLRAELSKQQALTDAAQHIAEVAQSRANKLQAKIERMERQEPVAWQTRTRPAWNDGTWGQWRKCSEEYAQDIKKTPLLHDWLYEARALYAQPGAQPAPNVTTAMLVAVADLAAQMEIVSRVGFIDTPNDKDSCAAFCVAEGTWLELMSCVESLAVAITSAPKPEGE